MEERLGRYEGVKGYIKEEPRVLTFGNGGTITRFAVEYPVKGQMFKQQVKVRDGAFAAKAGTLVDIRGYVKDEKFVTKTGEERTFKELNTTQAEITVLGQPQHSQPLSAPTGVSVPF